MPTIQGQIALADTSTTALTVGASEKIEVFQIELHSVHFDDQTIQVYFVPNNEGSVRVPDVSHEKESFVLSAGQSLSLVAPKAPWILNTANDTVQIKSTVAAALNYWITYAIEGIL